jgi:hypothetical protein
MKADFFGELAGLIPVGRLVGEKVDVGPVL